MFLGYGTTKVIFNFENKRWAETTVTGVIKNSIKVMQSFGRLVDKLWCSFFSNKWASDLSEYSFFYITFKISIER